MSDMSEQNAAARAALAAVVANGALSNGGLSLRLNESAAMSMLGLAPFMNAAGMDAANACLQMDAAFWMFQNTCPICRTVLSNQAEFQLHCESHIAAAASTTAMDSADLNAPDCGDSSIQDEEENQDEECEEINERKNSEALEKKQSAVNVN